ncbi:MAG: right-handed parallel beta-helix repeat-containing protein [Bacteroidales bacterium]|nr:right-handed parallel beta-helix repeat-containing protein [Bacteroidales bacterium]
MALIVKKSYPEICLRAIFQLSIMLPGIYCYAQDKTIAGEIRTPYPTIVNLAIEWFIEGDDNQNGTVTVRFREKGEHTWKEGMPLRRVPAGNSGNRTRPTYTWKNKHSGSIFDLKSGTGYEIHLALEDPDGGSEQCLLEAATRPVPQYDEQAEIIELQAGSHDTLFTRDGFPDKPVVYRCSGGKAIFTHVDLNNRNWVFVEGLTVINFDHEGIGIQFNGARNCVISHCTVDAVYGIVAYKPGAENCYISDNVVTGVSAWTNVAMGAHGANIGEGIELTGPGNVICYNRVTGFRDCISTMEDRHVVNQTCIDIYNNDIYRGADDAIEADFCFSNCRIFRNRITNCFVGLSSQPGLGGPNYFVRNVMYNITHGAFKLKRFSQGDVVLHNTVIKVGTGLGGNSAMDHAYFRNNLAIGGPTGGVNWGDYGPGNPCAADIIDPGIHSSFDYDAVGVYDTPYVASIGDKDFSEAEKHGVERLILHDVFEDIEFPNPPVPERDAPDLRPKASSRVVDAAVFIPNINDGFKGSAPDCGAYEAGQELPHYGPRNLN